MVPACIPPYEGPWHPRQLIGAGSAECEVSVKSGQVLSFARRQAFWRRQYTRPRVGGLATSEGNRSLTALVAGGALDAELAALLWLLAEHGVPLVVAGPSAAGGAELRSAIAELTTTDHRLADQRLAGRSISGASTLAEVLSLAGGAHATEIPDSARELGVVVIVDGERPVARVASAHYIRPVERDAHGHAQRRPPAVLSARDGEKSRLDHFWWAIIDELATRARLDPAAFTRLHRARTALLAELAAARVVDIAALRAHLARDALAEGAAGAVAEPPRPDARH